MGWWSRTVFGGDGPMDLRGSFDDIIGIGYDFFERIEGIDKPDKKKIQKIRNKINKNLNKLIAIVEEEDCDDIEIGYQCLGAYIMEFGAVFPQELKDKVIKYAENDDWASDNTERKGFMTDLVEKVKAYPTEGGVCVDVEYESLLDKVHQLDE